MSRVIIEVTDHCEAVSLVDVVDADLPQEAEELKAADAVVEVSVDPLESLEGLERVQSS